MGRESSACRSSCFRPRRRKARRRCFEHVGAAGGIRAQLHHLHLRSRRLDAATRRSAIVSRVHREFQLPVATHLTCVGSTVDQLRDYLRQAAGRGRGKCRRAAGRSAARRHRRFEPVPGGFSYANELVTPRSAASSRSWASRWPAIRRRTRKRRAREVDLANLKRKVDAGADVVVTQLFYDNADFFAFRERCEALGIRVPIVPGLLPITNFAQIKRITSLCGAKLPAELVADLEAAGDDAEKQFELGVDAAIRQTQELIDAGVPGIHFYVLNRSEAAARVLGEVQLPGRGSESRTRRLGWHRRSPCRLVFSAPSTHNGDWTLRCPGARP